MAKLDKVVKLYKPGVDAVAVAGTKAELNGYKLQGWSEKPAGEKQSDDNKQQSGGQSGTSAGGKKK